MPLHPLPEFNVHDGLMLPRVHLPFVGRPADIGAVALDVEEVALVPWLPCGVVLLRGDG